jgi:hypothetical protein
MEKYKTETTIVLWTIDFFIIAYFSLGVWS